MHEYQEWPAFTAEEQEERRLDAAVIEVGRLLNEELTSEGSFTPLQDSFPEAATPPPD